MSDDFHLVSRKQHRQLLNQKIGGKCFEARIRANTKEEESHWLINKFRSNVDQDV